MNSSTTGIARTTTFEPFYPVARDTVPFPIIITISCLPFVLLVICFICVRNCGARKVKKTSHDRNHYGGEQQIATLAPAATFLTPVITSQYSTTIPPGYDAGNFQNTRNNFVYEDPPPPYPGL